MGKTLNIGDSFWTYHYWGGDEYQTYSERESLYATKELAFAQVDEDIKELIKWSDEVDAYIYETEYEYICIKECIFSGFEVADKENEISKYITCRQG